MSSNEGGPHKNLSSIIVHCRDFTPHLVESSCSMQSQTNFFVDSFIRGHLKKNRPLNKERRKKIINQVLRIMNDIWFMYLATLLVNTHINLHNFLIKKEKKSYESRPRSFWQNFYDHFTKKVHRGNMSWFLFYHKRHKQQWHGLFLRCFLLKPIFIRTSTQSGLFFHKICTILLNISGKVAPKYGADAESCT